MVHIDTAKGDQIAVVGGAKVLLVLCPTSKSVDGTAKFKFVGTAYAHSSMDEQARSWQIAGEEFCSHLSD